MHRDWAAEREIGLGNTVKNLDQSVSTRLITVWVEIFFGVGGGGGGVRGLLQCNKKINDLYSN